MAAITAQHWASRIRALGVALPLLAPIGALAASPEDDYLAARDRYIADLKTLEAPEDASAHSALQEKDTKDLEQRLKAMIGPFAADGFPAEGKLNADLYPSDRSFGEIDGLVYGDKDNDTGVIVTTGDLLDKWLLHHPRRWSKSEVPHSAAAAVGTEAFYTQGLNSQGDAAIYAIVPIIVPDGAKFAKAMLAISDIGPEIPTTPDRLFIALETSDRIFIVSATLAAPMKGIAACDAVLASYDKKVEAAEKAYAGANDPKSQEKLNALAAKRHEQGQAAFLSCFKHRIGTTPEFKAATKQAAGIVEALAKSCRLCSEPAKN